MIDRAEVLECLKELGLSENPESYGAVIDCACSSVYARLKDKAYETDWRAVFLAAAQANYIICCGSEQSGGFDSFTAGDVSFSGSTGAAQSAKAVLAAARENAADLINDGAFAFKSV